MHFPRRMNTKYFKGGLMINEAIGAIEGLKSIFSGIKIAMDIADKQKSLGKDYENVELLEALVKMRKEAIVVENEVVSLMEELKLSKNAQKLRTETKFEKGVFWGLDDSGPYCPTCLQGSNLLAYLTSYDVVEKECWLCTKCGKEHITPEACQRMADRAQNERFKNLASGFPRVTNSLR